jgi:hypothetical protein
MDEQWQAEFVAWYTAEPLRGADERLLFVELVHAVGTDPELGLTDEQRATLSRLVGLHFAAETRSN